MKRLSLLMPLLATSLIPTHGLAACKATQIQGLYGLITQAIGPEGVDTTTLSLFDLKPDLTVQETYFVNTPYRAIVNASATGTYSLGSDCDFLLEVRDSDGSPWGLTGQFNPKTRELAVIQTIPNKDTVAMGTMHPVDLKHCGPATFKGRYAFLSGGRVPASSNPLPRVPEARIGWFTANRRALYQPLEWVNFNGDVTQSEPTVIPSKTLRSCLMDISDGGFAGVVIERGQRALYMDLAPGSTRTGLMAKVRN